MSVRFLPLLLLTLFLLFFYKVYGKKAGFDQLETIWLSMGILSIYMLVTTRSKVVAAFLLVVPTLRTALLFTLALLLSIAGMRYRAFQLGASVVFDAHVPLTANLEALPKHPTIVMANYPSNYVEYFVQALVPNVVLLVHGPAVRVLRYVMGEEKLIPVTRGSYAKTRESVRKALEKGSNIFCYVERDYWKRSDPFKMTEFRSGMFSIAKEIGATITPLVADHICHTGGVIDGRPFVVQVGQTQRVSDVVQRMQSVRAYMEAELRRIRWVKRSIKQASAQPSSSEDARPLPSDLLLRE